MHDEYDKYIILSFINATLVLSIGEKVVEVPDSGLDTQRSTIHVGLLEDDAMIQVFSSGIRHIRKDKRINQWNTEGKVIKATSNARQVVVALAGGEIIYFEIDSIGQLAEMEKLTLESEVVCMDIANIPEGRQRCKFLAVGLADHSVKVFSLEPESCLTRLAAQVRFIFEQNLIFLFRLFLLNLKVLHYLKFQIKSLWKSKKARRIFICMLVFTTVFCSKLLLIPSQVL